MRIFRNNYKTAAITWLLLLAFVSLLAATMAFTHIHVLPDGKIVVHSHALPVHNGPGSKSSHSHTQAEMLVYHGFTVLSFLLFVPIILILISNTESIVLLQTLSVSSQHPKSNITLRAPPASSL